MSNQFAEAAKRQRERKHASEPVSGKGYSRVGSKHVGGYFSPEVSLELRRIALEEGSSVQNLLAEGINMVFQSRGKPTIASS